MTVSTKIDARTLRSYEGIVDSWGYIVLGRETTGSYQGDHEILLRSLEWVGLAVIGYGSCSGCDHLQSITEGWDDEPVTASEEAALRAYSAELESRIRWFEDAHAAIEYLRADHSKDGSEWYFYDDEVRAVFTKFADILEGLTP